MKHPEEDYKEIARLGQKLGLPVPQLFLSLEVTKDGEVLETYKDRSRTWNRMFWNSVFCLWSNTLSDTTLGTGHLGGKTYTGSAAYCGYAMPNVVGPATNDTLGIVIGTGSAVEDFDGYALTTRILHGNSSLKMSYALQNTTTASYDAPSLTWTATLARIFNNNSGASIIVAETGIYVSQSYTIMTVRDVLAPAVTVTNGSQLTVTYNMTLTLPA